MKYIAKKLLNDARYRRLREYYHGLVRKIRPGKDGLAYAYIDISGKCNLDCRMCSFQKWHPKGMMSLETFRRLERPLAGLGLITLHCNCEPLLNGHITDIIRFVKSVNKNTFICINTNGMLLDRSMSERLLSAGLNEIRISVDGATKKTHESIRRGSDFDKIIANIKELVRQRGACDNDLKYIKIITVASKSNVDELPAIIGMVRELRLDGLDINGMDVYSEDMKDKVLYAGSPEEVRPEYEKIFSAVKEAASKHNIGLRLPSLSAIQHNFCEIYGCVIDFNGDVSPCSLLSYERPYYYFGKKTIHPKVVFGNIKNNDLSDIWNSERFKKFRNDLRKGRLPSYCVDCTLRDGVIC